MHPSDDNIIGKQITEFELGSISATSKNKADGQPDKSGNKHSACNKFRVRDRCMKLSGLVGGQH